MDRAGRGLVEAVASLKRARGVLTLCVPNQSYAEWIANKFGAELEMAADKQGVEVRVAVSKAQGERVSVL